MIQVEALYEVYHTSSTCDQLYVLSMLRTYCLAETLAVILYILGLNRKEQKALPGSTFHMFVTQLLSKSS